LLQQRRTDRAGFGVRRLTGPLCAALVAALLVLVAGTSVAGAEKVHDLSRALLHGKSEKARISAAVSLGRLRDPRSVKPLVRALTDDSNVVRALAATALGQLADREALPALERASQDRDITVRRRASEAIGLIRRENEKKGGRSIAPRSRGNMANYSIAPREPRTSGAPQVFVVLKSTTDKSIGDTPSKIRQLRATHMRSLMVDQLKRDTQVTLMASVATELGIEPYSVDVTIQKLERFERGQFVEIECEIRVAISNERGKMLSFLTGGAKVQVPRRTFRAQYEPQLKREALENAVKSVHGDLVKYLRNRPS
jgi:hypothetical protein